MTPPYNGWYETYEFKFDDQLIKADNLNRRLLVSYGGVIDPSAAVGCRNSIRFWISFRAQSRNMSGGVITPPYRGCVCKFQTSY